MRSLKHSLPLRHLPLPVFTGQPETVKKQMLGAICFFQTGKGSLPHTSFPLASEVHTEGRQSDDANAPATCPPVLQVAMPVDNALCEVWLGGGNQASGEKGAVRYRHDGNMLFGVIELPEIENTAGASPLQHAATSAYLQIFALLDELQYPVTYRFWNYMSDINGISHGLERYRQFNHGRQEAYLASGRDVKGELPAACALGRTEGPLAIAFLAGRTPFLAIENPRQISAYEYPQEYGPRSPTFSRSCLLPEEGILFISGTASIVGHQTLHPTDVIAQTQETLANLQALIDEANSRLNQPGFDSKDIFYRVYMRHATDKPLIKNEMERTLGPAVKVMFVQADICRKDLLLEIEATASLSSELFQK